ncbi:transposase [Elizabethkingia sp. HX WHF]|uniref:transposase n=1 Tax=Elizabethkingia TaxID=308865 RepID=UPI0020122013|nr:MULTISPECIES: transposase [Elizabethkingia]MCL1638149.1 transposase [Elizabethkingia bruuniana]MDX8562740.1 transposase [Elizabethkingia sp. HX WHF]
MKYRRKVLNEISGATLKLICKEISERYEVEFIEIGYDSDHVPSLSLSQIVRTIKSIPGGELFWLHPEIK